MRMTAARIDKHLARVQAQPAAPAPRRGLIGFILLAGIEDTDRVVDRHPLITLAAGGLVFAGLWIVLMSVLEKVLG